jgi:predicted RecB family nuclease
VNIPKNFQFSQGSLQDYADCPRRFQLKYILQLAWPALKAEPALENEEHLRQGAAFHQLAQQYFLGISLEKLNLIAAQDAQLSRWWENFSNEISNLVNLDMQRTYPEISLTIPMGDFRLVGKFDLLAVSDQQYIIFDWKTAKSRKLPKREWVAANLQTRVYPYVLAVAGEHLNGDHPIQSHQIQMVYWYVNAPTNPLIFPYSNQQLIKDREYIEGLVKEIRTLDESPAKKTRHKKHCQYCVYRSLCNRGVQAGPLDTFTAVDQHDEFNFELDFDQIAEIEF